MFFGFVFVFLLLGQVPHFSKPVSLKTLPVMMAMDTWDQAISKDCSVRNRQNDTFYFVRNVSWHEFP